MSQVCTGPHPSVEERGTCGYCTDTTNSSLFFEKNLAEMAENFSFELR